MNYFSRRALAKTEHGKREHKSLFFIFKVPSHSSCILRTVYQENFLFLQSAIISPANYEFLSSSVDSPSWGCLTHLERRFCFSDSYFPTIFFWYFEAFLQDWYLAFSCWEVTWGIELLFRVLAPRLGLSWRFRSVLPLELCGWLAQQILRCLLFLQGYEKRGKG